MTLAGVAALVVGGARVGSGSAVRNEDVRYSVEWRVIAAPATTMTAALTAGSGADAPSKLARANIRFASTATSPIP